MNASPHSKKGEPRRRWRRSSIVAAKLEGFQNEGLLASSKFSCAYRTCSTSTLHRDNPDSDQIGYLHVHIDAFRPKGHRYRALRYDRSSKVSACAGGANIGEDMQRISVNDRGSILEITIDRPPANAIDLETSKQLARAFLRLNNAPNLRVGILIGGGERFFSAGWDLKAAAENGGNENWGIGGFGGLTELFDLRKPVIAGINGLAVGGGFEIALACDMIVAEEHAEFFLPEATVGVIADGGGVIRLPKKLPATIAREMLLTGRRMGAAEALARGLINEVVPKGGVLEAARRMADRICAAAPLSISAYLEVMRATEGLSTRHAYEVMRSDACPVYRQMRHSDDYREGPRAFSEKRPPIWKGY